MPELTDVLGTILRDVAKSRVMSDLFSRDISQEYQEDPILIDFPVPRVEIKEASLQLKLAVNVVEKREVNIDAIRNTIISRYALDIGQQVYTNLILEHPNADTLEKLIEEKNLDLKNKLPGRVEGVLRSQPLDLEAPSEESLSVLAQSIRSDLEEALRADNDLWSVLRKGLLVREIQAILEKFVSPQVFAYAKDLKSAVSAADRQTLRVDVAVTRSELLEVPEPVLSLISLATEIRNYEWTEVGEEDGKPIRRLRPE